MRNSHLILKKSNTYFICMSPKWVTEKTESMIDLIFVNKKPHIIYIGEFISDNFLIYCTIKAGTLKSDAIKVVVSSISTVSILSFMYCIISDWTFIKSPTVWNIHESANKHAPMKTKRKLDFHQSVHKSI